MASLALVLRREPLTPSGPLRVAIFWAPTLGLLAGFRQLPIFQRLPRWQQLLVMGSAAFGAIWATAYHAAAWQLKPLPTDDELDALGGKRFRRPSDGKLMEYWISGQPASKTVVVFCHRMDGKLGADYGRAKVEAVLRARNACLVSPSVPSLSASPPYNTDRPVQWLQQWTQDMLHLLEELGAEHVYVLGLSWGAQPCLNLAMACQEKGLLRGVAQIGGNYWDTKLVQYKIGADAGGDAVKVLFTRPILVRPLAYLLIRPMVPMMGDVSMFPEKELTPLRKHFDGDMALFGEGMVRSMSYFLHQNWQVGCLAGCQEAEHYVDLSRFDPAIPMHVNLGKEDNSTDEMQQPFLDQVEHAELRRFEGSHAGFPLDEIIQGLMTAKA